MPQKLFPFENMAVGHAVVSKYLTASLSSEGLDRSTCLCSVEVFDDIICQKDNNV